MASPAIRLMTFAEFARLPDPVNGRYELRSGEVVLVPPAKLQHMFLQGHIRDLFRTYLPRGYHAETEVAFRPSSDRDYRIADVAVFLLSRAAGEYFDGAPDWL